MHWCIGASCFSSSLHSSAGDSTAAQSSAETAAALAAVVAQLYLVQYTSKWSFRQRQVYTCYAPYLTMYFHLYMRLQGRALRSLTYYFHGTRLVLLHTASLYVLHEHIASARASSHL